MPKHLTEAELERISEFANTAIYDRDPEMLVPDEEEEEREKRR